MNAKKTVSVAYVSASIFAIFLIATPFQAFAAYSFAPNPPVLVNTATGTPTALPPCNDAGTVFLFFVDGNVTSFFTTKDGINYNSGGTAIVLYKSASTIYGSCSSDGSVYTIVWGAHESSYTAEYTNCALAVAGTLSCSAHAQFTTASGHFVPLPNGGGPGSVQYIGHDWFANTDCNAGGTGCLYEDGKNFANLSSTYNGNVAWGQSGGTSGTYIIVAGASNANSCPFSYSSTLTVWAASSFTNQGSVGGKDNCVQVAGQGFVSNLAGDSDAAILFFEAADNSGICSAATTCIEQATILPSGQAIVQRSYPAAQTAGGIVYATSDGNQNVLLMYHYSGSNSYAYSTNSAGSFVTASFTSSVNPSESGFTQMTVTMEYSIGGFTDTSKNEYGILFGPSTNQGSPNPTPQTQTVGSCFSANRKASMYLKNSTQYWFSANALGQEVVNNVQFSVESIKGSATQTLQLLLYGTFTAQSPTLADPAVLLYSKSLSISAGTVNQTYTVQVNIPLNTVYSSPLPFNFWAVGIVGNDHIKIQNGTVSGMTTQTGLASTLAQPSYFTSVGVSTTAKLQLCANGSYQSILPAVTITSTSTQSANSTTIITSTTISTVTTIGANLFSSQSNWPIVFLILLLPAGLFMGATKTLAGGLMGMMVGAVIGLMMGILPAYIFIGIVIALVAIAFIIRERTN